MGWDVIADDRYVLREFCDWAASIPYMAGTVMSKFNSNLAKGQLTKNDWTPKEVDDHLTAALGDKKDEVVAEFKKVQPQKKIQDVLLVDTTFRPGAKLVLARKLENTTAPVFNYIFAYEYPIDGGITSFHCSEMHSHSTPSVSRTFISRPAQHPRDWLCRTRSLGHGSISRDIVSEVRRVDDDKLLSLLPPPVFRF
jgi:hypothetical protein